MHTILIAQKPSLTNLMSLQGLDQMAFMSNPPQL